MGQPLPEMGNEDDQPAEGLGALRLMLRKSSELSGFWTDLPELVRLTRRADTPLREIEARVAKNPALAARVLRLANSAAFAGGGVMDLGNALTMIGLSTVHAIVMLVGIHEAALECDRAAGFDGRAYMRRCLALGQVCRLLCKRVGLPNPEEAYVMGLLQEIGYLALIRFSPERVGRVFIAAQEGKDAPGIVVERVVLGFDHAQVGGMLAEEWNLGAPLHAAIRCHHEPDDAPEDHAAEADLGHLASWMCDEMGLPAIRGLRGHQLDPGVSERWATDEGGADALLDAVGKQLGEAEQSLFEPQ